MTINQKKLAFKIVLRENLGRQVTSHGMLQQSIKKPLLNEIKVSDVMTQLDSKATYKRIYQIAHKDIMDYAAKNKTDPETVTGHIEYINSSIPNLVKSVKDFIVRVLSHGDIPEEEKGVAALWIKRLVLSDARDTSGDSFSRSLMKDGFENFPVGIFSNNIENFFKIQRFLSPEERDLLKYNSPSEIVTIWQDNRRKYEEWMRERVSTGHEEGTEELGVVQVGSDPNYVTEGFRVFLVKNKAAACEIGKGTNWCTADPTRDYFKKYYKSNDPLFVMQSVSRPKFKYQLHAGSEQFMDANDSPIYGDLRSDLYKALIGIPGLLERFPVLRDFNPILSYEDFRNMPEEPEE